MMPSIRGSSVNEFAKGDLQDFRDLDEVVQRRLRLSVLDLRDSGLADTDSGGKFALGQSSLLTDCL
jgi:hypothetical protein